MKKLNFKLLLLVVVLLFGCKKDSLFVNNPDLPSIESLQSGVVPDDPAEVEKMQLVMTQDLLDDKIDSLLGIPSTGRTVSKGPKERIPPTVSIISPTNNTTVSGTVSITVNATDNIGVTGVDCYIDNTLLASDIAAPWAFTWNTTGVSGGTHVIKVTAKDAAGNRASSSIQVNIVGAPPAGDVTPPSITITSPLNGSQYNYADVIPITVSTSDNVGVTSVTYTIDGTVWAIQTTSPYSYTWQANVSAGTHTIMATAKDAASNSTSTTNLITVNVVVGPPISGVPSSFSLVTPTPGNQGSEGSCMAFAVGYSAASIEWFYRTNSTTYSTSTNIMSPEYVYNYGLSVPGDCNAGSSLQGNCMIIRDSGVCTWSMMPYTSGTCSPNVNDAQRANAVNYKLAYPARIYNVDSAGMKNAIYNKHAIMLGISIDNNFYNAGNGYIWRTFGTYVGAHGVAIVGWDDSKHAWKAINSWGTGWGSGGFIWIDYDLYVNRSSYYVYYFN